MKGDAVDGVLKQEYRAKESGWCGAVKGKGGKGTYGKRLTLAVDLWLLLSGT